MENKIFEMPEVEIILFANEDVVTDSNVDPEFPEMPIGDM